MCPYCVTKITEHVAASRSMLETRHPAIGAPDGGQDFTQRRALKDGLAGEKTRRHDRRGTIGRLLTKNDTHRMLGPLTVSRRPRTITILILRSPLSHGTEAAYGLGPSAQAAVGVPKWPMASTINPRFAIVVVPVPMGEGPGTDADPMRGESAGRHSWLPPPHSIGLLSGAPPRLPPHRSRLRQPNVRHAK